jgi:hypothetical protein
LKFHMLYKFVSHLVVFSGYSTPISSTNTIDRSEQNRTIVENGDKQNQKQS